ncbi:hypothetical protein ACF07Y_42470 [Streptomyces sp. NPDC016566]|uniref:hypothetical protein n=1 Tax=Streptomyces sp. NPDC016566 TaxID=3364967 RepID=UPI00370024C1
MTSEFTQVAASVIPVIILAAVLEANVYSSRAHDAFESEAQAFGALQRDLVSYYQRGDKPPVALAQQYRDAVRASAQPRYWSLTATWTLVVLLLSFTELLDLSVLGSLKQERWQWLAQVNLWAIGLGFVLLVFLPIYMRLRLSSHGIPGWNQGIHLLALRRARDSDASPDAGPPTSA